MDPELRQSGTLPDAFTSAGLGEFSPLSQFAIFLDYDGTLTPIVSRPELAAAPEGMVTLLESLADDCVVGIITGRDVDDLRSLVAPQGVWVAGSHGFDVRAPDGTRHAVEVGRRFVPSLEAAADELERELVVVPGAWVEHKAFAVAVHFRQVDDELIPSLDAIVGTRGNEVRRVATYRWETGVRTSPRCRVGQGPSAVVPPRADRSGSGGCRHRCTSVTMSPTRTRSRRFNRTASGSRSRFAKKSVLVAPQPIAQSARG